MRLIDIIIKKMVNHIVQQIISCCPPITLVYSCLYTYYVSCRYLGGSSVKHGFIILLLSSAIADVLTSVPLPLLLSLSHAWISMISTITPMSLSNCWPLRGSKQLLCCCECSTYVFSQCRRYPSSLRGRVYIHTTLAAVRKKFRATMFTWSAVLLSVHSQGFYKMLYSCWYQVFKAHVVFL